MNTSQLKKYLSYIAISLGFILGMFLLGLVDTRSVQRDKEIIEDILVIKSLIRTNQEAILFLLKENNQK